MRENFETVKTQIDIKNVACYLMGEPTRGGMFRYPTERTPSIKIYEETQTFFDYGRNFGGDAISLWAHVKNISNWDALNEIRETFGIDKSCDNEGIWKKIEEQKTEQREKERAKKFKQKLWRDKVDDLKSRIERDNFLLESEHIPPFCDIWCMCIEDRFHAECELDFLCNVE